MILVTINYIHYDQGALNHILHHANLFFFCFSICIVDQRFRLHYFESTNDMKQLVFTVEGVKLS